MKAVIVELRGEYAAVLSDDGCVRRLKNKGYALGQEIELNAAAAPGSKLIRRIAVAAAAVAVISLPAYAYCSPYSYVSLDVNPSIEYSLNRFDRVLSCTAVNGDGAEVLKGLELKGKKIEDALCLTLSAIAEEGYLTAEEPCGIVIAASSKNAGKSDRLAEALAETAEETAAAGAIDAEVAAEAVGQERVQEAKSLGVTPGKLSLIEKLQESAAGEAQVNVEDWLDKPVKDILEQIAENGKAEKSAETDTGNGKGNAGDNAPEQKKNNADTQPEQGNKQEKEADKGSQSPNESSSKGNQAGKSSGSKASK